MRKIVFFLTAFCLLTTSGLAQLNVQLHYDLGYSVYGSELTSRPRLTATVENFTADKWGSTYFFIDADLGDHVMKSAYGEISRELQFWKMPIAAHVEYNGGLSEHASYKDAYLVGPAYNWSSADYSKGLSLQVMYKYLARHQNNCHSWQVTGVWRNTFAKGLCTFSGFADLWHDTNVNGNLVLLAEPQFWLNLAQFKRVSDKFNLSIGAELEVSNNFIWPNKAKNNRFYAIPTLACKWGF